MVWAERCLTVSTLAIAFAIDPPMASDMVERAVPPWVIFALMLVAACWSPVTAERSDERSVRDRSRAVFVRVLTVLRLACADTVLVDIVFS